MTRIRKSTLVVAVVSVLTVVVVAVVSIALWSDPNPASAADGDVLATTTVTRMDLTEAIEADGELTLVDPRTVVHQMSEPGPASLLTAVAEVGQTLEAGDIIYTVNEQPVVYLPGDVPAWRTLSVDVEGVDVLQLEEALVALGYDGAGLLSVDETYTSYTADLVALWQEDLGFDSTGVLDAGSIVFAPSDDNGAVVVVEVQADVGAPAAGSAILTLSDGDRRIEFEVGSDLVETVVAGTGISVRLPDRQEFEATVVARSPAGEGQWQVTASIDTAVGSNADAGFDPRSIGRTGTPVTVRWSDELVHDVLAVPAEALLRHDDGRYTVNVVDGDRIEVVTVSPGLSAGRHVEVSGPLSAGDLIVVP